MSKAGGFHLWPRSLYGQILLVAALALALAQGINAAMLLAGARSRAVAEASTQVVGRVVNHLERQHERDVRAALFHDDPPPGWAPPGAGRRRPGAIAVEVDGKRLVLPRYTEESDMAERASEFLSQSDIGLTDVHIVTASLAVFPQTIREKLAWRVNLSGVRKGHPPRPDHAVLFTARMADGRWINAAGLIRPNEAGSLLALLLQTLTLYVAVMIPLALVALRIARPLRQLTSRVKRVGLAGEMEPLTSNGPEDVRQLIDAFNAMQARVGSLLGEKDVMLGAIGHDLKTPLAALRVRIESVEDEGERDKMAATIDEMVTILDDILMLARLGRSGEAPQRTDLDALVEAVVEEFEDSGKAASFKASDQRHVAPCRPVLLRRALRNLISNAVLYGKQATVSVEQNAGRFNICIDDNGPGIPPAEIESMFEPFARAEKARNRATGGTGLGLTIARAIARAHGGDIKLENRSEGGLRAILELPSSD